MIYFTADTHFGCDRLVSNHRPFFANVFEHDNALIELTNKYVKQNDTLVMLGDFCKEKPGRYRPLIRCKNIFFILGNHDNENKIKAVFGGNVWKDRYVKINGANVYCNHFPCFVWEKSHYGSYHAYGHTHCNEKLENMMDLGMPGRRSMDVGVDMAFKLYGEYRPISEYELIAQLGDKPGHDFIPENERWPIKDYS